MRRGKKAQNFLAIRQYGGDELIDRYFIHPAMLADDAYRYEFNFWLSLE